MKSTVHGLRVDVLLMPMDVVEPKLKTVMERVGEVRKSTLVVCVAEMEAHVVAVGDLRMKQHSVVYRGDILKR